jgi:hypothetical protein
MDFYCIRYSLKNQSGEAFSFFLTMNLHNVIAYEMLFKSAISKWRERVRKAIYMPAIFASWCTWMQRLGVKVCLKHPSKI